VVTVLNNRMLQMCAAMMAQGIIIYTITYALSNNATKNLYRDCTTQPSMYFNSPAPSDMIQAFREIGDALSNLRIAE
jgi:hypothetical protein